MADVEIGGAPQFHALAKRLEAAADRGVVTQAIARGIDPLVPSMRVAVAKGANRLPHTGGLSARVARTKLEFIITKRKDSYHIKIRALPNAIADPAAMNRGRVKHLTYGHRPEVIQIVRPGFFSDPLKAMRPQILKSVEQSLSRALKET